MFNYKYPPLGYGDSFSCHNLNSVGPMLKISESLEKYLSNIVIKVHIWEIKVFANLAIPWIIAHGPRPKNDKLGPRQNFDLLCRRSPPWVVCFWLQCRDEQTPSWPNTPYPEPPGRRSSTTAGEWCPIPVGYEGEGEGVRVWGWGWGCEHNDYMYKHVRAMTTAGDIRVYLDLSDLRYFLLHCWLTIITCIINKKLTSKNVVMSKADCELWLISIHIMLTTGVLMFCYYHWKTTIIKHRNLCMRDATVYTWAHTS